MNVVGLTGGIGSGKTTVAKLFMKLGIPVYFADDEAKKLMHSSPIKEQLIQEFGEEVYKNGMLNRPYLAQIVFNDKHKLSILNKIVHPEVGKHFANWIAMQDTPYCIQENAILFENNSYKKFNTIIAVTAPLEEKMQRVMQRDKASRAEVEARMNNQWPDKKKTLLANYTIVNIDLNDTEQQVLAIHEKLKNKA